MNEKDLEKLTELINNIKSASASYTIYGENLDKIKSTLLPNLDNINFREVQLPDTLKGNIYIIPTDCKPVKFCYECEEN